MIEHISGQEVKNNHHYG